MWFLPSGKSPTSAYLIGVNLSSLHALHKAETLQTTVQPQPSLLAAHVRVLLLSNSTASSYRCIPVLSRQGPTPSSPTYWISLGDTGGRRAVLCNSSLPHQWSAVAEEHTFPWSCGWEGLWKDEAWTACHIQADLKQLACCYQLSGEISKEGGGDHGTIASKSVEFGKDNWCFSNPALMGDLQYPLWLWAQETAAAHSRQNIAWWSHVALLFDG